MVNNYQRGHIIDHNRRLAYSIFDTIRYIERMVEELRDPDYMGEGMGSYPVDDLIVRELFERLPMLYSVPEIDHESMLPDLLSGEYLLLDDWFFRFGVRIMDIESDSDSTDPSSVMDMPVLGYFSDPDDWDCSTDTDYDSDYTVENE